MTTAVQVESLLAGLTDGSGNALSGGKVYTYNAGTTTPISLYTAGDKSTSATNPIILNAAGKAQVWADGRYKFVVKTSADALLYTWDNLVYGFDDSTVLWGGQSTGSANAQTISVPATVLSYTNGQQVTFIAGFSNSGAATLQLNSLGAVSIVKGASPTSLQTGDIVAGNCYTVIYEAYSGTGRFRLSNYPTIADLQLSRAQYGTNVAGINTITADLTPAIPAYETGLVVRFKPINTSTNAVTLNLNNKGAKAIQFNNAALVGGELAQGVWHEVVYDGTQFQLLNPALSGATRTLSSSVAQVQDGQFTWAGTSAGTATAYTASLSPAISSYVAGQRFTFKAHATNGASATISLNGLAAKAIKTQGAALVGNEFAANDIISIQYDGTDFQLLNVAPAPLFVDRANSRLGLGTTAPSTLLHLKSTAPVIRLEDSDGASSTIYSSISGNTAATGSVTIQADPENAGTGSYIQFDVDGTTKALIDANGRFGLGTSAPDYSLDVLGAARLRSVDTNATAKTGRIVGQPYTNADGDFLAIDVRGLSGSNQVAIGGGSGTYKTATEITFFTGASTTTSAGTERMRIDSSGNLLFNTSSTFVTGSAPKFYLDSGAAGVGLAVAQSNAANSCISLQNSASSGSNRFLMAFYGATSATVGTIAHNGTNTTYATSSDYRLKDDIEPMQGAVEKVKLLKPCTWTWKSSGGAGQGFIAHELQETFPEAVVGVKDDVDENGTPRYQAVDPSYIIATLTSAIQSLIARVEALEGA